MYRYARERELCNLALGRFVADSRYNVDRWLTPKELREYKKLMEVK